MLKLLGQEPQSPGFPGNCSAALTLDPDVDLALPNSVVRAVEGNPLAHGQQVRTLVRLVLRLEQGLLVLLAPGAVLLPEVLEALPLAVDPLGPGRRLRHADRDLLLREEVAALSGASLVVGLISEEERKKNTRT